MALAALAEEAGVPAGVFNVVAGDADPFLHDQLKPELLQAAADEGILAIGVDSNQNALHPGQILTSMVKRVDNAVFDAFTAGTDLEPGVKVMDLAAGGVDVAVDDNNAELVTAEMQAAVDEAKAAIASGEVTVHDFMTDNACPAS